MDEQVDLAPARISFTSATTDDQALISNLGRETFFDSHSTCAPQAELQAYLDRAFAPEVIAAELADERNLFFIAYVNGVAAGYSKIIPNCANPLVAEKDVCKLERIYIGKAFYGRKVGLELFKFNVDLARELKQRGLWLNVWTENTRAIEFYRKAGFSIIGETSFRISERHANPNHWMFLSFKD